MNPPPSKKPKMNPQPQYYPFPTETQNNQQQQITLPQEIHQSILTTFPSEEKAYNIIVTDVDNLVEKEFQVVVNRESVKLDREIYNWLNNTHVIDQPLEIVWNDSEIKFQLRIMTKTERINDILQTWEKLTNKFDSILEKFRLHKPDEVKQARAWLVSIVEMLENSAPSALTEWQCQDMIAKTIELIENGVAADWLQSSLQRVNALASLATTRKAMAEDYKRFLKQVQVPGVQLTRLEEQHDAATEATPTTVEQLSADFRAGNTEAMHQLYAERNTTAEKLVDAVEDAADTGYNYFALKEKERKLLAELEGYGMRDFSYDRIHGVL